MVGIPKPRRIRDTSRLAFARQQGCILKDWVGESCSSGVDAHHVTLEGHGTMGGKPSDFRTFGLCRLHHDTYHFIGKPAFETCYRVDLESIIADLNKRYALLPQKQKKERLQKPVCRQVTVHCDCTEKIHKLTAKFEFKEGCVRYWCRRSREYKQASMRRTA